MTIRGLLILARRFLVLLALMFWQGGFTFYAAVVVPTGQRVLGDPTDQGFITRQVTQYLNLSGAVALLILALDLIAAAREATWARRLRWLSWLGMVGTLVALVWLHPRIDQYLDPELRAVVNHRAFRAGHRTYLWLSTVQWGCGLAYAWLTLRAWREADRV
jgi:hypothetical protein